MNTFNVCVNVSKPYSVIIEKGSLINSGKFIKQQTNSQKALIVTDTNVSPLYAETVMKSLELCDIYVNIYCIEAGEKSKTPQTLLEIVNYLARNEYDRGDVVIALGGGVVGDVAGFAAAVYKRGMKLVQIPTSLLAMVDSSVGGKTAVDLPEGKNLMGAFKQPNVVLCDPDVLVTLPKREFACGMAEVIKYAMIFESKLFDIISNNKITNSEINGMLLEMIEICVSIKADIVAEDEFDNGKRKLLNFGHTIGHAVEAKSGFEFNHGESVAIGMAYITCYAERSGKCAAGTYKALVALLKRYELPCATDMTPDELTQIIMSDKKRNGNTISWVIPKKIGNCIIADYAINDTNDVIRTGRGGVDEC